MIPIPVNLATEDELSETVLHRILSLMNRYAVGTAYRRGGFGYLRRTIHGWNNAARGIPFIVLTDLDTCECPRALINDWLPGDQHPNLLLRVAVRDVESWILADTAFAAFLNVRHAERPVDCDTIPDPKSTIVELARNSRSKSIRERVVPRTGSTAKQGPDYNACLGSFVRDRWNVNAAAQRSRSLARAVARLATFTPSWPR